MMTIYTSFCLMDLFVVNLMIVFKHWMFIPVSVYARGRRREKRKFAFDIVIADSDEFSSDEELEKDDPLYVDASDDDEDKKNELYPIDVRKKIVEYWWNNGNKRKFSSVQKNYKKLTNEGSLRIWKNRFDRGACEHFHSLFLSFNEFIHSLIYLYKSQQKGKTHTNQRICVETFFKKREKSGCLLKMLTYRTGP